MRAQKVRVILVGLSGFCSLVCGATIFAQSETSWTADQQKLLDVARSLSKTTLADGAGWESYGKFLQADFNRWTEGRDVIDRESSIKMIREWWEAGNRRGVQRAGMVGCGTTPRWEEDAASRINCWVICELSLKAVRSVGGKQVGSRCHTARGCACSCAK